LHSITSSVRGVLITPYGCFGSIEPMAVKDSAHEGHYIKCSCFYFRVFPSEL